jgi:ParB family chromosome partitioning protein
MNFHHLSINTRHATIVKSDRFPERLDMRGCSSHYHETLDLTDSVDTKLIDPPRIVLRNFREGLDELICSIREKGLIQPIVVRPVRNRFEVIAGARRLEACKRLHWSRVPCIVRDISEKDSFEMSLTENIQRRTMNPIEEARAFKEYIKQHGWGGESELAKKVGKSQEYISQRLSLLNLSPQNQEKIIRRLINPSAAFEISRIDDMETQAKLVDTVLKHKLTVGMVRETTKAIKRGEKILVAADAELPKARAFESRQFSVHDNSEPEFLRPSSSSSSFSLETTADNGNYDAVKDIEKASLILRLALSRLGSLIDEMPEENLAKDLLLEKRLAIHNMLDSLIKAKIKIAGIQASTVPKLKLGRLKSP